MFTNTITFQLSMSGIRKKVTGFKHRSDWFQQQKRLVSSTEVTGFNHRSTDARRRRSGIKKSIDHVITRDIKAALAIEFKEKIADQFKFTQTKDNNSSQDEHAATTVSKGKTRSHDT